MSDMKEDFGVQRRLYSPAMSITCLTSLTIRADLNSANEPCAPLQQMLAAIGISQQRCRGRGSAANRATAETVSTCLIRSRCLAGSMPPRCLTRPQSVSWCTATPSSLYPPGEQQMPSTAARRSRNQAPLAVRRRRTRCRPRRARTCTAWPKTAAQDSLLCRRQQVPRQACIAAVSCVVEAAD